MPSATRRSVGGGVVVDFLDILIFVKLVQEFSPLGSCSRAGQCFGLFWEHHEVCLRFLPADFKKFSDAFKISRRADDLYLGSRSPDVACAKVDHRELVVGAQTWDGDDAAAFELPGAAAGRTDTAAVLLEEMADFMAGAITIVSQTFHQ